MDRWDIEGTYPKLCREIDIWHLTTTLQTYFVINFHKVLIDLLLIQLSAESIR